MIIIELTNHIYNSFNEKKFTLAVFTDLSKAFVMVDHTILITKLKFYGVKSLNLKWLKSYLTSRTQFIKYDN